MSDFSRAVSSLAEGIVFREREREGLAKKLKSLSLRVQSLDVREDFLFKPVTRESFTGRVVAVDGGLVIQSFHSSDLIVSKSASVCFSYEGGELKACEYFPSKFVDPVFNVLESLDRSEVNVAASIQRIKGELKVALESVKEFKPEYLLLDGSLLPQNADKPSSQALSSEYAELLQAYEALFDYCSSNNVCVVGVVEDSRATRFMSLISSVVEQRFSSQASVAGNSLDTSFLHYFLSEGERSFVFNYATEPEKHPVLRDFKGEWPARVRVFYLKSVERDRPLRLEFLDFKGFNADDISKLVLNLTGYSKDYGVPAPIVEADLRAKLDPKELEWVSSEVFNKLAGKGFFISRQRRDSRPF